jgi:hypothetical protein
VLVDADDGEDQRAHKARSDRDDAKVAADDGIGDAGQIEDEDDNAGQLEDEDGDLSSAKETV